MVAVLSDTELTALSDLYQRKEPLMAVAPAPAPVRVLDLDCELHIAIAVERLQLAMTAAQAANRPVPEVVSAMTAHLEGWSRLLAALEGGR